MALRERLIYAIEIVGDGATKGIGGIKSAIHDADGAVGKFKAGTASAFSAIGANAAMMGVAAGGAIAAFSAKAVMAFTDTAKASLDLSTSTGLNIEQASRWVALADDYEVTSQALATGLGKVSKTLDSAKWAKYGIETKNAAGESRAVNDILMDTFEMLSRVTNETDKARIGQELFGKGYQSLTPLLGHTREEYEKLLAAQKDGQVITEEEARKAEETRLAIDEFKDSLNELTMALGQTLAPAVADILNKFSKFVNWGMEAKEVVDDIKNTINDIPGGDVIMKGLDLANPITQLNTVGDAVEDVGGKVAGWFGAGGDASEGIKYYNSNAQELIETEIRRGEIEREAERTRDALLVQQQDYVRGLQREGEKAQDAARAVEEKAAAEAEAVEETRRHRDIANQAADALNREREAAIRLVGGDIAIRDAKRATSEAYVAYITKVQEGTLTEEQHQAELDKVTQAYINQASVVAENRLTQMQANGEVVNAAVQQQVLKQELGNVAGALQGPLRDALLGQIALLDDFERPRTTHLTVVGPGGQVINTFGFNDPHDRPGQFRVGVGAKGAIVRDPTLALIGEAGDEAVVPLDQMPGASPLPGGGSGGGETHVHFHIGTLIHESQLAQVFNRAMTAWQRNGGRPTFTAKAS